MRLTQSDSSMYYLSFFWTTSTLKDLNYYNDLTSNQSSIHQMFNLWNTTKSRIIECSVLLLLL